MDARTFLTHIFRDCKGAPITASAEEGFQSRRWKPGEAPPEGKTYFGISTVLDIPRTRILRRRTEDLVETRVIVLDDWGTKVKKALPLEPSYLLESSPGNFQPGYILKYGAEPSRAAALIEALAAAGWTDPGAKRADRIMRIPGSLNDKYAEPWHAVLTSWKPDLTYTLSEIAVAFGVVPTDVPTSVGGPTGLEPGETDPVFEWLIAHGLVISGPNARGWYAVRCPWESLHSGEVDHGTDYLPGKPGAFVCLHGHCQDKRTAALRAWILEQDPAAELGLVNSVQLADLRNRLGAALGLLTTAPDSSRRDEVAATDVGETAAEGSLDRLWGVLQAQAAAGTMFAPRTREVASVSPARALAAILASIYLDPSLLPDADTTAGGKVARGQATTDVRVHAVMELIGMTARRNSLTGAVECSFAAAPDYDGAADDAETAIGNLVHACARCGMKSVEGIRGALVNRAMSEQYNPVSDWIQSAPWDGVSRLEALYASVRMRDPRLDGWKRVAIRRHMIQTVTAVRNWERGRAALDVGYVLVLQGAQGVGKSRWVGSLMPKAWVTLGMALKLDHNERDAVRRATMTPITELSEIDGSFRRSDTAALKNFLTAPLDIYRRPYGRTEEERPRCTSFIATVNPEGFLLDQTGERRFWTLAVEACDWNHGIDLQQLWAEVWTLQATGEPYWLQAGEMEQHKIASEGHRAETDITVLIDDLRLRRGAFPDLTTWVHANAKDLARQHNIRGYTATYADINAALEREGFERWNTKNGRGWRVPPYQQQLTPAQASNLNVIFGGKKDPEKG